MNRTDQNATKWCSVPESMSDPGPKQSDPGRQPKMKRINFLGSPPTRVSSDLPGAMTYGVP